MNETALPRAEAMSDLRVRVEDGLGVEARTWWSESLDRVTGVATEELTGRFPALRRRIGIEALADPADPARLLRCEEFVIDLAAYRRSDGAALLLFDAFCERGGDPAVLRDVFAHGDLDERVSALRCLPLLRDPALVSTLAAEAQRSNTMDVVEAAYCDHDGCARHLGDEEFHRLVLKLAFADIPFWRVLGGRRRAHPELGRMLQDFATEREAAGRPIWTETLILIALAPVEGSVARLLGHLEHGRDEVLRLAAAEGVGLLDRAELAPYLAERLDRETHPPVRAALERSLRRLT